MYIYISFIKNVYIYLILCFLFLILIKTYNSFDIILIYIYFMTRDQIATQFIHNKFKKICKYFIKK